MNVSTRQQLGELLLQMAHSRGPNKSLCPSEVARRWSAEDWRELMPLVRSVAAELVERGELVVLQRGHPVEIRDAKGPIRLRIADTQ